MNNYCIHLKKRKNKPYCNLLNKEIRFSLCRECDNKEYKNHIDRKKSGFHSKSPVKSGQINKNAQSLTKKPVKKAKMHNKSKKLTKLERNRFSVFTTNKDKCMFCNTTTNLSWHEIYRGKNRPNSMIYGFCLRMCLNCHDKYQEDIEFNDYWHRQAQLYWEELIGTREEFIEVFRRNYLR